MKDKERKSMKRNVLIGCFFLTLFFVLPAGAQTNFKDHCAVTFDKTGQCPEKICQVACITKENETTCEEVCIPKACTKIPFQDCPTDFCSVMVNCSGKKVCHYPMVGEKAQCGDLAYAGQDVACCEGFVRRCGVEFLDGTCDMEGINSVYSLPICIPCGNNICEQFEDACNCPEDCGQGELYQGFSFGVSGGEESQE